MILRTLLKHYLRHPMQALFLLAGIVIANVLLTGTQLINAQARASYAAGERVLGARPVGQIVPRGKGEALDERLFVDLRRRGFDRVVPVLRHFAITRGGRSLELLGVDALSMPMRASGETVAADETRTAEGGFGEFAFPPYAVLAAPARIDQLGAVPGERLELDNGTTLPPLRSTLSGELGHRLLIDLGELQDLTRRRGQLSSLLVFEVDASALAQLLRVLPDSVEYVAEDSGPDPAQMTRSLHLNLGAMGLLSCVVGLFLTYNAVAFSYTDRGDLLRKLRLAGVSRAQLAAALLAELLLFIVLGSVMGAWLGSLLAARLLPGLGTTLAQLYDVYIAYPDQLLPSAYWLPLLTTVAAALLCAAFPLRHALQAPMLERWSAGWRLQQTRRRDRRLLMLGIALLLLSALIAALAASLMIALLGMACLLLGAALCLPGLLRLLLDLVSRRVPARGARLGWLMADSRWLLGPAALALMAMTLALVANSGLNTMIGSFRGATDNWLQQRLAAQLFLRDAGLLQASGRRNLASWLETNWPRARLTLRYGSELQQLNPHGESTQLEVVDLAATGPFASSVSLLRASADAAARFRAGEGVFISERAWRLDGWQPGDRVSLCASQAPLTILGVYHDYGNPLSQWMVSTPRFRECWPAQLPRGIAIHGPAELPWERLRRDLVDAFSLRDTTVINQQELRQVGLSVFDRTFAVTRALNLLTLIVAGIGIFCSVSAIHHHRVGQQALLASLGFTRRERGALLLAQWGVLGLLCTLVVWPFGIGLGWYLSAVVTPVAFGWSFPLRVAAAPYLSLVGLAIAALVIAVALPSLRLLRVSPAAMLREQGL